MFNTSRYSQTPVLLVMIVAGTVIGQVAYTMAGEWFMKCDTNRPYVCSWGPTAVCPAPDSCESGAGWGFCVSSWQLYGCLFGGLPCPGSCRFNGLPCTNPAPQGSCW